MKLLEKLMAEGLALHLLGGMGTFPFSFGSTGWL